MTTTFPPHADGSRCWTHDCSLRHGSNLQTAIKNNDSSGYLKAREAVDKKAKTSSTQTVTYPMLEYGSTNYKLFMEKSEELMYQLDGKESKAVMEYTGWSYQQYYEYLEDSNNQNMTDELKQSLSEGAGHLDSVIKKAGMLDKPVTAFRGEKVPQGTSIESHLAAKFPVGQDINVKRYMSTSMDSKVASDILGDSDASSSYVLAIKTKEGAMLGEYLSEQGLREKEILLPRDRTYRVESVTSAIISWGVSKKRHTVVNLTLM